MFSLSNMDQGQWKLEEVAGQKKKELEQLKADTKKI